MTGHGNGRTVTETPLTPGQQGIWLQERMGAGAAYNVAIAYRITGDLDPGALADAVSAVVLRHEVLGMTVLERGGEVVGAVPDTPPIPDTVRFAGPSEEVRSRIEEVANRPFDLTREAPFRALIAESQDIPDEYFLCLVVHHMVFDDWSSRILLDEISEEYRRWTADGPTSPPGPTAAYAVLRSRKIDPVARDRDLAWWEEALRDAPEFLELPRRSREGASRDTHLPRPVGTAHTRLDVDTARRVRELAAAHGCTDFVTHLAAWAALVGVYSGQDDVLVGTPVTQRSDPATQHLVGYLLDTVVVRAAVDPGLSFSALLTMVRETLFDCLEHDRVSHEEVARHLAAGRADPSSRLFSVWFASEEADGEELHLPRAKTERTESLSRWAKFDLALFCSFSDAGTSVALEFDAAQYDEQTMERMARHYAGLLDAVSADPSRPLRDISLPDAQELRSLELWGRAPRPEPEEFHHLFAAFADAATAHSGRTALEHGDHSCTYAELAAHTASVARALLDHGVRRGHAVGVAVDRSVGMIAAVLGILRVGAHYVALDPDHPHARLAHMVSDTGLSVVLTGAEGGGPWSEFGARPVPVPEPWETDPTSSGTGPDDGSKDKPAEGRGRSVADVAYVTYTSGSTGAPKGIRMSHRAAWNLIGWQRRHYPHLGEGSRTLQFASLGFDVSLQEIFGTLTVGGTLVLIDQAQRDAVHDLMRLVDRERIERLFAPAPVVIEAAESAHAQGVVPRSLRALISGSEQLVVTEALRETLRRVPGAALHNEYGPSETHVATVYWAPDDPSEWSTWLPVGRPIGHTRVRLLDQVGRRVPVGSVGEVFISGPGLAEGYSKMPAVTAGTFVPDPFSEEPGARMYRTGDLARYLPDGNLEYLGRNDGQVKIRGFRVELEAVRSVLDEAPCVAGGFVRCDSRGGEAVIVGYWVPTDPDTVLDGDRRERAREALLLHMRGRLPSYMLPSVLIPLRRLPLTANGKVDQRELPVPDWDEGTADVRGDRAAPSSDPLVGAIRTAMAEVLGRSEVGEEEDFFSLGGHSLKANRLVWVLAASHGVEILLRPVFEERTPLRLARAARWIAPLRSGLPQPGPPEQRTVPNEESDAAANSSATRNARLLALIDEIGATDDDRT
ncbi:Non-ribosomal peptide synthetase [Nocardiopsis sp. JB363]|nr:Non-ribosomal peptide synthetase [Nocardiopsis sp. JB363]